LLARSGSSSSGTSLRPTTHGVALGLGATGATARAQEFAAPSAASALSLPKRDD